MAFSVVMPALEMAQETGKLLAWRKKEGDRVTKGEPLLDIETDKAVVEVEAPADGFLAGVKASEGADIPVGQTIAWIVEAGENPPADVITAAPSRARRSARQVRSESTQQASAECLCPARVRREDLPESSTAGKRIGSGYRARARDRCGRGRSLPPTWSLRREPGVRRTRRHRIPRPCKNPATSKCRLPWAASWPSVRPRVGRRFPHFFLTRDVDASALNSYRERVLRDMERTDAVRVTHTDLLVALAARVLLKHPRLNASWSPAGVRLHEYVNMGVAIAVNEGVVTAVIANAQRATLAEIASQRREIADRARSGKLRPADISGATFTISNLGMYQVDQFQAIIVPPQAAILAVGAIRERVVAVQGKAEVRPIMTLTVSCDHRVADGARAAMFLSDLAQALSDPEEILK